MSIYFSNSSSNIERFQNTSQFCNRSAPITRQYIEKNKVVNWDASAVPRGVISVEEELFSSRRASQTKTLKRTFILLVEERLYRVLLLPQELRSDCLPSQRDETRLTAWSLVHRHCSPPRANCIQRHLAEHLRHQNSNVHGLKRIIAHVSHGLVTRAQLTRWMVTGTM